MKNTYQTICNITVIPIIDISNSIKKTECMFDIRKFLNELKVGTVNEYDSYDAYISVELKDEDEKNIFLKYMENILTQYEPKMQH